MTTRSQEVASIFASLLKPLVSKPKPRTVLEFITSIESLVEELKIADKYQTSDVVNISNRLEDEVTQLCFLTENLYQLNDF
jgi:hypothetical protein